MTGPDFVIPHDQLPPGFAAQLDDPPGPVAPPRPAATLVLLREGSSGLEVLLLKRAASAAFVPGAYVFPGGLVQGGDAGEAALRLHGVTPSQASARLGLPADADPPGVAYYVAAIREAFEETGILLAQGEGGEPPSAAARDPRVRSLWQEVLDDEGAFPAALDRLGCRMDGASLEYIAHWITPEAEPRRYDTRFFAGAVPAGVEPLVDPREASEALWITPGEALVRHRAGGLPMVFPTLVTVEALTGFQDPWSALGAFRAREVRTYLPRLVRTPGGVRIQVDPEPR